ncbi:MAG TPA: hypothetical protein GX008_00070 [Firmicutes bacterium]|jgi:hypothetical protein|nr:MAG: hypothetical protein AA931_11390 [Peptococcaceae bacterium 1109]HHT72092.1 hypothetical protein [Bacillota bacterium]
MRVQVGTTYVESVGLISGRLGVTLADGRQTILLQDAGDFAVTRAGETVHIVAFDQNGSAWHFHGQVTFASSKVDLEHEYGQGSVLVTDGGGNVHLVFLTQPSKGQGASLCHQTFSGAWGKAMVISTHIRPDKWGFSASWDPDGFLHLAYTSHGDGHLLYRAFSTEQKTWSGAVPLVTHACRNPLFFPGDPLVLAWISEEQSGQVQMMRKGESWSTIRTVSRPSGACSGLGWAVLDGEVHLLWRQGEKLWKTPTAEDGEPSSADSAQFSFEMRVVEDRTGGAMTVPVYVPQVAGEPTAPILEEPAPVPEPVAPPIEERREGMEEKLQRSLIEQAFQLQLEWEKLREEYSSVQRLVAALEEKMEGKVREAADRAASLPRSRLESLTERIERLEIRLTKYDRTLRDWQANLEPRLAKLEQASLAVSRRLAELENPEPERKLSIWQRLWRL